MSGVGQGIDRIVLGLVYGVNAMVLRLGQLLAQNSSSAHHGDLTAPRCETRRSQWRELIASTPDRRHTMPYAYGARCFRDSLSLPGIWIKIAIQAFHTYIAYT